ncbi:polyprenyl diphosphate synthase [Patescibacteria group bacterium]
MTPSHIAFIVDGNRRWAKKRGLSSTLGHKKAADERLEELVYHCLKLNISYATFWVFSTENWKRGQRFANILFNILKLGLRKNVKKFIKDGIKLNTIGDLTKLPKDLVKEIKDIKEKSKHNIKLTVTIAINYGGRDEMLRAIQKASLKPENKGLKLTEKQFSKYLDTADLPDPDLIIRTGGDQRLSGFLLWQSQYAELYFTKTLFPDFNAQELDKALKEYENRQRRFGK